VDDLPGTLVDVGARDRVLQHYLLDPNTSYYSADIAPGHDFLWDLESPIDCADKAYDIVVALDVLEHLENIHLALEELLRIARVRLYVSLPNMTCLSFRLRFLLKGHISGKYDLLPEHQGDRHRWLMNYKEACGFVGYHAERCGFDVRLHNIVGGFTPLERAISYMPIRASLRTYTMLFELARRGGLVAGHSASHHCRG
jgi:hypothetical protein